MVCIDAKKGLHPLTMVLYIGTVRGFKSYIYRVYMGLHAFLMLPTPGALREVRGKESLTL
jgi:hypothetical protein